VFKREFSLWYYNVGLLPVKCISVVVSACPVVSIHSLRMQWISLISFGYIEVDFVVSELDWVHFVDFARVIIKTLR